MNNSKNRLIAQKSSTENLKAASIFYNYGTDIQLSAFTLIEPIT